MINLSDNFLKNLKTLVSYKSISTDSSYSSEVKKAKDFLVTLLKQIGFEVKSVGKNKSIVLAKRILDKNFKNLLIYGHYDVQPVQESDWNTSPFELTTKNGRLYGRGVADDKAEVLMHIEAVSKLIKENRLNNVNVLFLLEGEEESGSRTIKEFISKKQLKEKIDYILISDSLMVGENIPTIVSSLRGNITFEINLRTATQDMHSGIYGGALPNAINEVINLHNKVFTQSFLNSLNKNKIEKALENSNAKIDKLGFTKAIKDLSSTGFVTDSPSKKVGLNSTLEIIGMYGGYTKEGIQNIIPAEAVVKYNLRLNPLLKASKIWDRIEKEFKKQANTKKYKYSLRLNGVSDGTSINIDSKLIRLSDRVIKKVYKKDTIFKAEGGSIPIVNYMSDHLTKDILLIGFSEPDSNLHGPNENMKISNLAKGMEFAETILQEIS